MSSNNKRLIYSYAYDALDRHIKSGTSDADVTQLFYCQKRLITEIKGTASTHVFETERVVLAQHALQGSAYTTTLIAGDDKRSTLALLNNSQPQSLAYNPYGHSAELPMSHLMAGFNGERRDPLSGYYLLGNGYRAFNPALMRFNSPDSLSPFGDGWINAYAYCGGDPVNREDPTGHIPFATLTKAIIKFKRLAHSTNTIKNNIVGALTTTRNLDDMTSIPMSKITRYLSSQDTQSLSKTSKKLYDSVNLASESNFRININRPPSKNFIRNLKSPNLGADYHHFIYIFDKAANGKINGVLPSAAVRTNISPDIIRMDFPWSEIRIRKGEAVSFGGAIML